MAQLEVLNLVSMAARFDSVVGVDCVATGVKVHKCTYKVREDDMHTQDEPSQLRGMPKHVATSGQVTLGAMWGMSFQEDQDNSQLCFQ
eukprot:5423396-Amphidinium_carterae.1